MSFLDLAGSAFSNILKFSLQAGKPLFRDKLRSRLWKSVIRSVIKLVLIFAAILVVIFLPFGEWWSELTAYGIFIGVFVWSLVNTILTLKNNYKLPLCMIQEKSVSDGILEFVNQRWPVLEACINLYDSLRIGKGRFTRHFNQLPASHDVVKDYLLYIVKDIIFFAVIFAVYFFVMTIGFKTLLLQKYTDLSNFKLYVFPFVQVYRFIMQR